MKLLITCTGRRVELIDRLSKEFDVLAVDASESCAASIYINQGNNKRLSFATVPKCSDENYIEAMLKLCEKECVDLLVPLYEPEFLLLCKNRDRFMSVGTRLVLSDTRIIEICNDKKLMQNFFEENQIKTPRLKENAPAIVKPVNGMGSCGIFKVDTDKELEAAKILSKGDVIIQELVEGTEYTIDTLCDFDGNVVIAVPRIRCEVRDGEVSKSQIDDNKDIIQAVTGLVEKLNKEGNVIGPLTIQCFLTKENEIVFIEVNPRFGGGVPLSLEASEYVKLFRLIAEGDDIDDELKGFKKVSTFRYIKGLYS